MNGWMGNLLRVNLTTKTSSIESSEKYFKYIGGKGMANRIMYDEVPVGTDPAAPETRSFSPWAPTPAPARPAPAASPFRPCPPSPSITPSSMRTWRQTPPCA